MALYVLENPTGSVNGSNTTFTTENNIVQICSVIVDGITYLGEITTTDHNQFSLGDAPNHYVYITYFGSPI